MATKLRKTPGFAFDFGNGQYAWAARPLGYGRNFVATKYDEDSDAWALTHYLTGCAVVHSPRIADLRALVRALESQEGSKAFWTFADSTAFDVREGTARIAQAALRIIDDPKTATDRAFAARFDSMPVFVLREIADGHRYSAPSSAAIVSAYLDRKDLTGPNRIIRERVTEAAFDIVRTQGR